MKSSKLRNFTAVLSKAMELFLWVIDAVMAAVIVILIICKDKIKYETVSGFKFNNIEMTRDNYLLVVCLCLVMAIIALTIAALIFRSINLIFKKTNTESPFSESNVKLIRRIGFLSIMIPFLKIVTTLVVKVVFPSITSESMPFDVGVNEFIYGLIILCLSEYFAYGASLEKDVNGLV